MRAATRWGAVLAVVCSGELFVAAVIGGAGLAVLLRSDAIVLIGLIVVVLISSLIKRRQNNG